MSSKEASFGRPPNSATACGVIGHMESGAPPPEVPGPDFDDGTNEKRLDRFRRNGTIIGGHLCSSMGRTRPSAGTNGWAMSRPGARGMPRQEVRPVGVHSGGELGIEDQMSRGVEVREVGQRPQSTKRSSSRVAWAFPCEAAERPSGWSSEDTRVATRVRWFREMVMALL